MVNIDFICQDSIYIIANQGIGLFKTVQNFFFSVRLKSRGRTDVGSVEIRVNDGWVEVCDEKWDNADAKVKFNSLFMFLFENVTESPLVTIVCL